MDELAETVGKLSMNAKEWRPGQGFTSSKLSSNESNSSSTSLSLSSTQPVVAQSPTPATASSSPSSKALSRGESAGGSIGSGGGWSTPFSRSETRQSWGEPPPQDRFSSIDANGTHFFSSWESRRPSTIPAGPTAPPHRARPGLRALSLSDELWRQHRDLALESQREMDPGDPRHKAVPSSFGRAFCLDEHDAISTGVRSSFGYPASTFKVMSNSDGHLYLLRRFDSVRCVSHKIAQTVMSLWTAARHKRTGKATLDHPGLVRWYKCFLSQRAVFFVHHYHAGGGTLRQRFFDSAVGAGGVPLPEPFIWSCLTQLVSAILAVHGSNLAVRSLQLNHILCTPEGTSSLAAGQKIRLRINCIGILDVLEFEARKSLEELQMEDMRSLGCILLSMATGTEIGVRDCANSKMMGQCGAFLRQNYSRELQALADSLLHVVPPTAPEVAASMASLAFEELDAVHVGIDGTSNALAAVYESGRALRLMLKLAFVNERPEFGIDKHWSESGDCYILKLFRDFVFHQADGAGRPIMDLGHVISSLNKLDAADEEKIVLASRDGKNILVVSFADVAWCLEKAYQELCSNSVPHPSLT